MRVILPLLLLVTPVASGSAESRREPTAAAANRLDCVVNRVQHAAFRTAPQPRRLDELPAGQLFHAVERQVDGCRELVLVSEERRRR
jgi:hypothetical protein